MLLYIISMLDLNINVFLGLIKHLYFLGWYLAVLHWKRKVNRQKVSALHERTKELYVLIDFEMSNCLHDIYTVCF